MHSRLLCGLAFLALAAPAGRAAPDPPAHPAESTPAKNWVLPQFTDEGFRSMTLRGTEVRQGSPGRIDIVGMNITVFSRDAAAKIDSILLSPTASYFPKENRATGAQSVRLIDYRDSLEVEGLQWTYDRDGKKISIARQVRVVIHTPLPDLLK